MFHSDGCFMSHKLSWMSSVETHPVKTHRDDCQFQIKFECPRNEAMAGGRKKQRMEHKSESSDSDPTVLIYSITFTTGHPLWSPSNSEIRESSQDWLFYSKKGSFRLTLWNVPLINGFYLGIVFEIKQFKEENFTFPMLAKCQIILDQMRVPKHTRVIHFAGSAGGFWGLPTRRKRLWRHSSPAQTGAIFGHLPLIHVSPKYRPDHRNLW